MKLSRPAQSIYPSPANAAVLQRITLQDRSILDIGCGTGELARAVKQLNPGVIIDGITYDAGEQENCRADLRECYLCDLDHDGILPTHTRYDLIIFSHVLEHVRWPADTVHAFAALLSERGRMIIVVPNFLYWTNRLEMLTGNLRYTATGLNDVTHLRQFTFNTIEEMLVPEHMQVIEKWADGHLPLGKIRLLSGRVLTESLDRFAINHYPGLFGVQFGLVLHLKSAASR